MEIKESVHLSSVYFSPRLNALSIDPWSKQDESEHGEYKTAAKFGREQLKCLMSSNDARPRTIRD
jgi:hypothetical protein